MSAGIHDPTDSPDSPNHGADQLAFQPRPEFPSQHLLDGRDKAKRGVPVDGWHMSSGQAASVQATEGETVSLTGNPERAVPDLMAHPL